MSIKQQIQATAAGPVPIEDWSNTDYATTTITQTIVDTTTIPLSTVAIIENKLPISDKTDVALISDSQRPKLYEYTVLIDTILVDTDESTHVQTVTFIFYSSHWASSYKDLYGNTQTWAIYTTGAIQTAYLSFTGDNILNYLYDCLWTCAEVKRGKWHMELNFSSCGNTYEKVWLPVTEFGLYSDSGNSPFDIVAMVKQSVVSDTLATFPFYLSRYGYSVAKSASNKNIKIYARKISG